MPRLFSDNAITTLATGITGVETEMTVAAGKGAGFPIVDGTDSNYFVLTMEDAAGNLEFIRVDHRVGDVFGSVTYPNTRAYDSSSAQAWIAADTVDLRWTAASMNTIFLPSQDLIPETTNLYDIGSATFKFKDAYFEGNITIVGTVDGRSVDVDGVKLDTITWTGAAIKALYELEANAFTDTKDTKLTGIETGATADQTGAEIKALYELEANAFTDLKNTLLNSMFHVGFVMHSTVATNPATLGYPGTWTQTGQGRVLMGEGTGPGPARTAGATLGQDDAVVVTHDHGRGTQEIVGSAAGVGDKRGVFTSMTGAFTLLNTETGWVETGGTTIGGYDTSFNFAASGGWSGRSSSEGVAATDKNLQPSLVVYIWERTA